MKVIMFYSFLHEETVTMFRTVCWLISVCGSEIWRLHTSWPAAGHLCDVRTGTTAVMQVVCLYLAPCERNPLGLTAFAVRRPRSQTGLCVEFLKGSNSAIMGQISKKVRMW